MTRLICLAAIFCWAFCPLSVHAGVIPFCDHFEDGDHTDGIPGTWIPGKYPGGIRDSSSGDFVTTDTGPGQADTALEELTGLEDVSIRTQFRFSQYSGDDAAYGYVFARQSQEEGNYSEYWGGIKSTDASIAIGYTRPTLGDVILDEVSTSLDPFTKDVLFQFDVVGNQISLTAWQEGEPQPPVPQMSVTDSHVTEGGALGIGLGTEAGVSASLVHRYVCFVPEPSTFILAALGLVLFCGCRRRATA